MMVRIIGSSAGKRIEVRLRKDVGTAIPALPYEIIVTDVRNEPSFHADVDEVIKRLVELGVLAEEAAIVRDLHGESSVSFTVPE